MLKRDFSMSLFAVEIAVWPGSVSVTKVLEKCIQLSVRLVGGKLKFPLNPARTDLYIVGNVLKLRNHPGVRR